jgi:multidrug efflux system membrane fusion protein
VEIDPRPFQVALEMAEGQMARDQATLANARVDLDRYTKLVAQNAVPEQQLATQKALVDQYVGVLKSDQAQIDSAKLNLVYCSIHAEITGRVGLRLVDPGNIVHATDTNGMLVITQIQPISVIFTVAEDDLPVVLRKIAAGEHLQAEAWDRGKTTRIAAGTLETVDNQIDPTTGSLRLRANYDNSDNQLFPNQFVNVRLLVQEKGGVTLVNSAVIQRANTVYAYVVKDDHTVTVRQIATGVTEGDNTEVTSGLEPGDVAVMTGVDKLQEGTPVTVQMADENSGGKSAAKNKSGGKKK